MSPERRTPRPRMVWNVASRDLLSTVRDRRTLLSTVLMPLLVLPLLTLGLPLLMGKLIGGQVQEVQRVGVVGVLPAGLRDHLTRPDPAGGAGQSGGVRLVPVSDPLQAVQSGEVEAALRVKDALPQQAGNTSGTLEIYAKLSNFKSQAGAYAKVRSGVESYNHDLTLKRLRALGLSEPVLTPVQMKTVDASAAQEKSAGMLAFMVPMLMMSFLLSGGMATALDSTAGEKERGTLESLLVSPVRRAEVVAGKLLSTTLTALVTGLFSLLGFLLTGLLVARLGRSPSVDAEMAQALGGQLTLAPAAFGALVLIVLSTALVISALLIALGLFARSYKEAQTYTSPLSLLIVLPAAMLQFADFVTLSSAVYLVPVLGSMLAILEVVKGQPTLPHTLAAVAGNLVAAGLLGVLAWRTFGREEVIFRN